ncbi:unnamed protein product [Calypogeia fissa]
MGGKTAKRKKLASLLRIQGFSVSLVCLVVLFSSLRRPSSVLAVVEDVSNLDDWTEGLATVTEELIWDKASQVHLRGQAASGDVTTCIAKGSETCWHEGTTTLPAGLQDGREEISQAATPIGSHLIIEAKDGRKGNSFVAELLDHVNEFPELTQDFEEKGNGAHESSPVDQANVSGRKSSTWNSSELDERFRDLHHGHFGRVESSERVTRAETRSPSRRSVDNNEVFGHDGSHFGRLAGWEESRRVLVEVPSSGPSPAASPATPQSPSKTNTAVVAVAITVPITAGITIAIAIVCFIFYRRMKAKTKNSPPSDDGSANGTVGRGGGVKEKDDRPLLNTMWLSRWGDGKKADATVFSVDSIQSSKKNNPLYESHPPLSKLTMEDSPSRDYGTTGFLNLSPEQSLKKLRGGSSPDHFVDALDHSFITSAKSSDATPTNISFHTPAQTRVNIDVRVSIDSSPSFETSSPYVATSSQFLETKLSRNLSSSSPSPSAAPPPLPEKKRSFSLSAASPSPSVAPSYPLPAPPPPPPLPGGRQGPPAQAPPPPPGGNKAPPPPPLPSGGNKAPPPPPPPPGGKKGGPPPPPPPPGARMGGPPPPPPPPGARMGGPPPPPPPPGARMGGPPPPPPPPGGKGPRPPPPPGLGLSPLRLPTPGGGLPLKPSTDRVLRTGSGRKESLGAKAGVPVDSKKLKPLHWDKVKPAREHDSVWNNLLNGSFELDTQEMEKLFLIAPAAMPKVKIPGSAPKKEVPKTLIEPRKAHNISIQLRGLGLSTDEVIEGLLEGDETIPAEVLEKLSKMSLSEDEERKILEFKGPRSELGPAEKFLQTLLEVPNAFQRINTMLFRASFKDDLLQLEEAITVLEMACKEVKGSRTFVKLLEAVLKAGNRLNMGTFRGDAQAFKLETLLRLADIKGTDGKTSLLHFVIQEIIRAEGSRAARLAEDSPHSSTPDSPPSTTPEATPRSGIFGALYAKQEMGMKDPAGNSDTGSKHLGLKVVMGLSTDLANVKRAAGLDTEALSNSMTKLFNGLKACRTGLRKYFKSAEEGPLSIGGSQETDNIELSNDVFTDSIMSFVTRGENDVARVQKELTAVLESVKSVGMYFYGDVRKDDSPLRVFQVVKDFLVILDRACKEVAIQVQNQNRKPPVSIPFPPTPRG